MSKDLDAVIQFIQQPNTDYAYMLDRCVGIGQNIFLANTSWYHGCRKSPTRRTSR